MKILKFQSELIDLILMGKKTTTWRLYDDKNLSKGDEIMLVNKQTNEKELRAKLIDVREKTLEEVNEEDFEGHEKFESEDEMYETYRKYYGDKVGPKTPLKVIKFEVIS